MVSRTIPFRYMAISDREVCPDPIPERVRELLDLGVPAVQIRDKTVSDRTRWEWLRSLPGNHRENVLFNSRVDFVVLAGLGGVHRARSSISTRSIRRVAKAELWVGVSAHDTGEALKAQQLGADYCTFGPIYPTPSKPRREVGEIPGLEGLDSVCRAVDIPVLALGGVGPGKVEACLEAGAHGVAGIRALFGPSDPAGAWNDIRRRLDGSNRLDSP